MADPKMMVGAIDARQELEGAGPGSYAAMVCTVGYESRARYVRHLAAPEAIGATWAYRFEHHNVLAYKANLGYFEGQGDVFLEPESAFEKHLRSLIDERVMTVRDAQRRLGQPGLVRFAVDISSMDRDRLARTVQAFATCDEDVEVDFFYSFAKFVGAFDGSEGRVLVNRSAEGFEGWTDNPSLPLVCVVGLGFESRLALAALETLEPTQTVWLVPRGVEREYEEIVRTRNSFAVGENSGSGSTYDATRPYETLLDLETTVAGLARHNRVVIVPLGPKIFALCGMLTSLVHPTNVGVWRLSADSERKPVDRTPNGHVAGIRVRFVTNNK